MFVVAVIAALILCSFKYAYYSICVLLYGVLLDLFIGVWERDRHVSRRTLFLCSPLSLSSSVNVLESRLRTLSRALTIEESTQTYKQA